MHFMPLLIVFTGDHESTGYHGSSGQQGNRRMDALCLREGKQNEVRSWGAVSERSGPLSDLASPNLCWHKHYITKS